MKIGFRKVAAFFAPRAGGGATRERRPASSSPKSHQKSASTHSGTQQSSTSSGSPRPVSEHGSVKSSSKVLIRLKSWFEKSTVAPAGYFSVDVGKEKIRYVIPIAYLSHEDLQKLLDDAVAEFGHSYTGALQLACEKEELQEVLEAIHSCYEGEREDDSQRLIAGRSD